VSKCAITISLLKFCRLSSLIQVSRSNMCQVVTYIARECFDTAKVFSTSSASPLCGAARDTNQSIAQQEPNRITQYLPGGEKIIAHSLYSMRSYFSALLTPPVRNSTRRSSAHSLTPHSSDPNRGVQRRKYTKRLK
jgi:hypothetical protein